MENHHSVLPTHETQSDPHHQNTTTTTLLPPSYLPPPDHSVSQQYWSQKQERRVLEYAFRTRLARSKRRLARQRALLSRLTISSSSSSSSGSATVEINNRSDDGSKGWFDFCTPNGKRLRVLLKKDLKKSDVGSLGRIVLPKRETEENLPFLLGKEGMQLVIRDIYTQQEWVLKFKFWANNKSRMYVLEHTGEFVKQNGMESGDSLFLYEDENKNMYYSVQKASKSGEVEPPETTTENNDKYYYQSYLARDEEDASLAVLIEQLKHKEQKEEEEARSLMGVFYASNTHTYGFNNNYTPQNAYPKQIE